MIGTFGSFDLGTEALLQIPNFLHHHSWLRTLKFQQQIVCKYLQFQTYANMHKSLTLYFYMIMLSFSREGIEAPRHALTHALCETFGSYVILANAGFVCCTYAN